MIFRLCLILYIIAAVSAEECPTAVFSHTYPSSETYFSWRYYCFEENAREVSPNTMILNDQLRGVCKDSNVAKCEESLLDVPYDAISRDYDGTNWKFFIGLADSGIDSASLAIRLMLLDVWESIYPPFVLMHFPEKNVECNLE